MLEYWLKCITDRVRPMILLQLTTVQLTGPEKCGNKFDDYDHLHSQAQSPNSSYIFGTSKTFLFKAEVPSLWKHWISIKPLLSYCYWLSLHTLSKDTLSRSEFFTVIFQIWWHFETQPHKCDQGNCMTLYILTIYAHDRPSIDFDPDWRPFCGLSKLRGLRPSYGCLVVCNSTLNYHILIT